MPIWGKSTTTWLLFAITVSVTEFKSLLDNLKGELLFGNNTIDRIPDSNRNEHCDKYERKVERGEHGHQGGPQEYIGYSL